MTANWTGCWTRALGASLLVLALVTGGPGETEAPDADEALLEEYLLEQRLHSIEQKLEQLLDRQPTPPPAPGLQTAPDPPRPRGRRGRALPPPEAQPPPAETPHDGPPPMVGAPEPSAAPPPRRTAGRRTWTWAEVDAWEVFVIRALGE